MTQDISCDWNFSYKLVTAVQAADKQGREVWATSRIERQSEWKILPRKTTDFDGNFFRNSTLIVGNFIFGLSWDGDHCAMMIFTAWLAVPE